MTVDPIHIGLAASSAFLSVTMLGYGIWRKAGRLGFFTWAFGYLVGSLLIVSFFAEFPRPIVWSVSYGYLALATLGFYQAVRCGAFRKPKNTPS